MTSKKRRYGDLSARPLPTENADLIDDVFAAFTGTRPPAADAEADETRPDSGSLPQQPNTSPNPTPIKDSPRTPTSTRSSRGSSTRSSAPPSPRSGTSHADAAPTRDFMKVANSITREAVPSGMFASGKSKQLYDYFYSLTRGAIVPVRSVRISKEKLMEGAGIGSKVTLDQNIRRLCAAGLLSVEMIGGVQGGNEYTVFLPEETSTPTSTGTSTRTTPPSGGQKLAPLPPLETSPPSRGLTSTETGVYTDAKTLIKTYETNDDDEALADFLLALKQAAKEVTGRELSPAERPRWAELADVLVKELRIAAGRTTVSSAPAFLAEHLRRRLWKVDKRQSVNQDRELPDQTLKEQQQADTRECPDCFGTGMWYPEGYDKGVAKCHHEKWTRRPSLGGKVS